MPELSYEHTGHDEPGGLLVTDSPPLDRQMLSTVMEVFSVTEASPYLSRSGLLTCFEMLSNPTLTDEYRAGVLKEVFDHIDAQGHLLARTGNVLRSLSQKAQGDAETHAVMGEIRKAIA